MNQVKVAGRANKYIKYLLFVAFVVFMTACPFQAPFPIDEPGIKYSSSLVGKWAGDGEDTSDLSSYYLISDIDGYSFRIEENTYDEDEDSWSTTDYSAHLSEVGDNKFINVYSADEEVYYFYRMDWDDPEQFSLYAVTDYIDEEFDSSEEMKIFFEKYCELSFFYQSSDTYIKIE